MTTVRESKKMRKGREDGAARSWEVAADGSEPFLFRLPPPVA